MQIINSDLVIVGAGLAGLRAAIQAARKGNDKIDISIISKVHLMRAHSVAAEGGTAAVLYTDERDSLDLHGFDTVKGADYLADQDAVELFVKLAPEEILRLEHWGMPWSRRADGRIDQRPFGGHSFPRACYGADKTGFYEMQTLYDTLLNYAKIHFYEEWFLTSIIVEEGTCRGITAINMRNGDLAGFSAKAVIIATGGLGRLYGFTTYSHGVTGDGAAASYRAGVGLKDVEFIQFHPTGLVPSGILITEAVRGEGGILVNNKGERFMTRYAAEKKDLAPRDMISRSIITEIMEGRGFAGPNGLDYVLLDFSPIGTERVMERLPMMVELGHRFAGLNPLNVPLPIRPVAHYSMGGIHVNIKGETTVKGLWAAGECACVSVHGGNRLGSNSTALCLVYGRITGEEAAKYLMSEPPRTDLSRARVEEEERRIFDDILGREGGEDPYAIKKELLSTMDQKMYVFRNGTDMTEAFKKVRELKTRYHNVKVVDKSKNFNTNLIGTLEVGSLLEIAEAVTLCGLMRKESRGAHARKDFPKRDDINFLSHSLSYYTPDGPKIDYMPVVITKWIPAERKY